MNSKLLELEVLLANISPDVFCATEHWYQNEDIKSVHLEEYRLHSFSSRSGCRGGGTAIYSKPHMKLQCVHRIVDSVDKDFEYSMSLMDFNNETVYIVCVYRSPSGNMDIFIKNIEIVLYKVTHMNRLVILCGDFNTNFIGDDPAASTLEQIFLCYGLTAQVKGVTRPSAASGSQIDNIFTNLHRENLNCIIHVSNISDHFGQLLSFTLEHTKEKVCFSKKRFFTEANIAKFKIYFSGEDWAELMQSTGVDREYSTFANIFLYYFDLAFPLSSCRVENNRKPWVSTEIKEYSKYVKDLYVWYKHTKSQLVYERYKDERKKYRQYLSNYKKSVNDSKITNSKNRSKSAWAMLNSQTNKKKAAIPFSLQLDSEGMVNDPLEIAEAFNAQFNLKVATPVTGNFPITKVRQHKSLFIAPTDEQEVFNVIMALPNKYSSGFDEVPVYILKYVARAISKPLSGIVNHMFETGIFPDTLKKAKVVPVFKKGDPQKVDNYRPVSLLPSVSKVFERLIYSRLMDFITKTKQLVDYQYGFVPNKSTELAVYRTLEFIVDKIDKNQTVSGLYFDLSKAFDTINHQILLERLEHFGVRGICASLLKSYLTGREQAVCISSKGRPHYSAAVGLEQGLPQGSILGPLLFLVYVNGLGEDITANLVCQYADDTSIILARPTMAELSAVCSAAAEQMRVWCGDNQLRLNVDKTGLLSFSKQSISEESIYVRLDRKSVPVSSDIKFLGVYLDANLDWECHINSLNNKLNTYCGLLRRLRDQLFTDTIRLLYFSNIQSIMTYGILFWGSGKNAIKIFRTQKRLIRCILGLSPTTSCKPYFLQLGFLTVPSLYFLSLVTFIKKNPILFRTNQDLYSQDMSIVTRNREGLSIPTHNSAYFQKGPLYRAIKAYKTLPGDLRLVQSIPVFKKRVKDYLSKRMFYSFKFDF